MKKEDKERVVAELTERLRTSQTLMVADYRGLTMPQIDARIEQLEAQGDSSIATAEADAQTPEKAEAETETEENPPEADAPASDLAKKEEQ